MKLSAEMKVWIKGEKNRLESIHDSARHYQRQIKLLEKAIELNKQQADILSQKINIALDEWKKAK